MYNYLLDKILVVLFEAICAFNYENQIKMKFNTKLNEKIRKELNLQQQDKKRNAVYGSSRGVEKKEGVNLCAMKVYGCKGIKNHKTCLSRFYIYGIVAKSNISEIEVVWAKARNNVIAEGEVHNFVFNNKTGKN